MKQKIESVEPDGAPFRINTSFEIGMRDLMIALGDLKNTFIVMKLKTGIGQ